MTLHQKLNNLDTYITDDFVKKVMYDQYDFFMLASHSNCWRANFTQVKMAIMQIHAHGVCIDLSDMLT